MLRIIPVTTFEKQNVPKYCNHVNEQHILAVVYTIPTSLNKQLVIFHRVKEIIEQVSDTYSFCCMCRKNLHSSNFGI